jgi:hypothetical protein
MEPSGAAGGDGGCVVAEAAVVAGGAVVDGLDVVPLEEPLFEYDA